MKQTAITTLTLVFSMLAMLLTVDAAGFQADESSRRTRRPVRRGPKTTESARQVPSGLLFGRIQRAPRKKQLNMRELLSTLGKDFNSDWMSIEKPKVVMVDPKPDTLPPPHSHLWQQIRKANLSHVVRHRLRHDGNNETIAAVENWLMAKAACPIRYVWEDAGPLFWPRWIKRGDCSGPGERVCSWPPGMHCVPNASATLHVLRWHCRLPASRRTTGHGASSGTLSSSSDVTGMPAAKCQWLRVPFPVTAECACAC